MSGGSMDYLYLKVRDVAESIREREDSTTLHKAFAAHLDLVADALHDLEWEQSGDTGDGDADAAIREAMGG